MKTAVIRTLTISTTTFERMKGKFDGFRQTVLGLPFLVKFRLLSFRMFQM